MPAVETPIAELTREEFVKLLDRYALETLGMSLAEFSRRLEAGEEVPDSFAVADLKTLTGAAAA